MRRLHLETQRFGRLVVLGRSARSNYWDCICDCGQETTVFVSSLQNGLTRSCGCLNIELTRQRTITHGRTGTPEYRSWAKMRERCLLRTHMAWKNYGGRGIRICDRWLASFSAFYADMGPKPDPSYTLERIDNNGNYEPGNCRWASRVDQIHNQRPREVPTLTFNGETLPLREWAARLGITRDTLAARIRDRGWTLERALTTPHRDTAVSRQSR